MAAQSILELLTMRENNSAMMEDAEVFLVQG